MPNKKRWEWGVRTPNGSVMVLGTGPSGKRAAKGCMVGKNDQLVRRFVGRWRNS